MVISNFLVKGIDQLKSGALEVDFTKFEILPGLIETDVLQTIQALPGIQSIDETVSNLNIRGGTHDQNLLLWDGIKMYQSGHFFGLISAFNPQITQKVLLQKNGTSASQTDGVSGTIAMHTKERLTKKTTGNIGVNFVDVNGFVDLPIGSKSSLQLAARHSLNDLITTPTYTEYFNRIAEDMELTNNLETVLNTDQSFNFYDISFRWLFRPTDKDRVRLNFITVNNNLVFTENAEVNGETNSRESSIAQNSIAAGFLYERRWTDKWASELSVYNNDYKLKAINANLFDFQRFLQENTVSETGVKLQNHYRHNEQISGTAGYQFVETDVTNLDDVDVPLVRTLISEVVRTHSGFAELHYSSRDKNTSVRGGVRYNYLDKFEQHIIEPRLQFHHTFLEHFGIDISGELKHQTTSQVINFQNDFLGVEKRRWQLANDSTIPVVKSKQIGLGLSYSNNSWLLSAEGYFKTVDGITSQSQGFQNQYEFTKTSGNYEVFGIDFLLRKQIKNLNLWLSYSFMNNTYKFSELQESNFPSNFDITQNVTAGAAYSTKNWRISSGLNWRTGRPTTTPISGSELLNGTINFNAPNSSRLADYLRVDTSFLYRIPLGKLEGEVGASFWNVLNKKNELSSYYRIDTNDEIQQFVETSLGFTPNALLKIYF